MKKKTEHGKSAPSTGACTRLEYGIIYTLIGVAIIVVIFAISWLLIGRDKKNSGERGMAMETTLVENAANYSQPIQEESKVLEKDSNSIDHLVFLEDSGKRVASTTSIGVANAHCSATEVMFNPGYNTVIAIKGSSSGGKQSETISISRYESAGAVYTDEQGNKENAKLIGYSDALAQNSVSRCVCDITGWKYIKLSKVAVFNNAAVTSGSTEEFFVFTTLPVSAVIDNIENYYQIWGN